MRDALGRTVVGAGITTLLIACTPSVLPASAVPTIATSVLRPTSAPSGGRLLSSADPCAESSVAPRPVADLDFAGSPPLALASGDNRLWVAVGGEPTGQLFSVDPRAGIVSGAIPTGWSPQYVATADERVWVSATVGDNSHSSKDPHQNLVAEVRPTDGTETAQAIPEPGEIAVGHSYVWVVSEGSNLDRLDRTSAKLVDEPIHLDGTVVHLRSNGAQIFATSLLSPTSTTASLTVLDEATGEIQRTLLSDLALGPALFEAQSTWVPVRVADGWELDELAQDGLHSFRRLPQNTDVNTFALGGGGAVWAWTTSGCVYSFDLHSGSLVGSSWSLDESRGDAIAIAASGQDAWVLDGQGVVAVRR